MSVVGIAELARELHIKPRRLSDLIYQGDIDSTGWPLIAGRRLIPRDRIPAIVEILQARGYLQSEAVAS